MRIDPAPSEPWWSGPSPAAAAAPAPAPEPLAPHHPLLRGARRIERAVRGRGADGVESRIQLLDALEHRARQLHWRDALRADHGGEGRGGGVAEIGGAHGIAPINGWRDRA